MKLATIITLIVGALAFSFGLSLLLAFPVKWLWNSTLPELFGFKEIGAWMAWKLVFLSSLLFKSSSVSAKS
jgi:hypothetical protein